MNDQEALDIAKMKSVFQDEEPMLIKITMRDAWFLISALQMCNRHPGISDRMKQQIEHSGRQFQNGIAERHPQVEEILNKGWDESFDVQQ